MQKMMLAADCWVHGQAVEHQHFLDNDQTSYTKHVLLVWSRKTLVSIHWIDLRVNGISANSF